MPYLTRVDSFTSIYIQPEATLDEITEQLETITDPGLYSFDAQAMGEDIDYLAHMILKDEHRTKDAARFMRTMGLARP